mmetsp:Transcript_22773/g.29188  ORF Transcript_22773/g.29188 Transcript_22773/m.29188 type:complete len:244 (-) Transcript_22773:1416-2147(-)
MEMGLGLAGIGKLKRSHTDTMFLSHGFGISSSIAISGSCSRMTCPFSLVPILVRNLKEFSIVGDPGEVRICAIPVIITLSSLSNSISVNCGTSTIGASADAIFHCLPYQIAPSKKSLMDLTLKRNARATRRRRPASSKNEFMRSYRLKLPLTVIVNGSNTRGPPGVTRFNPGITPNTNWRRSIFKSDRVIEPVIGLMNFCSVEFLIKVFLSSLPPATNCACFPRISMLVFRNRNIRTRFFAFP